MFFPGTPDNSEAAAGHTGQRWRGPSQSPSTNSSQLSHTLWLFMIARRKDPSWYRLARFPVKRNVLDGQHSGLAYFLSPVPARQFFYALALQPEIGSKLQHGHSVAVWLWASYRTSRGLNFLTHKMGMRIIIVSSDNAQKALCLLVIILFIIYSRGGKKPKGYSILNGIISFSLVGLMTCNTSCPWLGEVTGWSTNCTL